MLTLSDAFVMYLRHISDVVRLRTRRIGNAIATLPTVPHHAIDKVEGLICTTRESLLGSGAWRAAFATEMQHRPFYSAMQIHSDGSSARCDVCGRSSSAQDAYRVYLYGPAYDTRTMWSSGVRRSLEEEAGWWNAVPEVVWDNDSNENASESDECVDLCSESSGDNKFAEEVLPFWKRRWPKKLMQEKESVWNVTNHCKRRTQLYHTLLHYKLRLLLKARN